MQTKTYLSTLSLSSILLLSALMPLGFLAPVSAEPTADETTIFFVDALQPFDINNPFAIAEHYLNALEGNGDFFVNMSELEPTDTMDTHYPPNLISGNKTITWGLYWLVPLFLDEVLNEYIDPGLIDPNLINQTLEDLKFIIPHPLRISEKYTYIGTEEVNITDGVEFNLFFSSNIQSKINKNDKVTVTISSMKSSPTGIPIIKQMANSTVDIPTQAIRKITSTSIRLDNISKTIKQNESLLFSIELIPGDKPLLEKIKQESDGFNKILNASIEGIKNIIENSENFNSSEIIAIIELIQNNSEILEDIDEDIAEILNSIISTSFVYDSVNHPSSVTIPFSQSENQDDNKRYYLHANNIMDSTQPSSSEAAQASLLTESIVWNGPTLSRNQILTSAELYVYLNYRHLNPVGRALVVEAQLLSNDELITTAEIPLEKMIIEQASIKPYSVSFNIPTGKYEILHDQQLTLLISLKNTSASPIDIFKTLDVIYDSNQYKSFLTVSYTETDHLSVNATANPSSGEIVLSDSVRYTLNINCNQSDMITVQIKDDTFSDEEKQSWDVTISPSSSNVSAGQTVTSLVTLSSVADSLDAYDEDPLQITIEITGKTGYTSIDLAAEVSEDAVTHDFYIRVPPEKEIDHGTNTTYSFIVVNNNTGFWPGRYIFDATSEHWNNITIYPTTFDDLAAGDETVVNVTLSVPKGTTVEKDTLTFTVISKQTGENITVTLNSTIIGETLFESWYGILQELSEDIGLDEIFGSAAAFVLIGILCLIILLIIIGIVIIMRTYYAKLICLNRIKEISGVEKAEYQLTIENPTKKPQRYQINTHSNDENEKWNIHTEPSQFIVAAKQKHTMKIQVEPTDLIEPGDWTEISVEVKAAGHRKTEKLTLMTLIKGASSKLEIQDVMHWPKSFQKDERVQTSFRIYNKGSAKTKKLSVLLNINGREKNKVEDIVIPALGFADITIPWTAEKGKNKLGIVIT